MATAEKIRINTIVSRNMEELCSEVLRRGHALDKVFLKMAYDNRYNRDFVEPLTEERTISGTKFTTKQGMQGIFTLGPLEPKQLELLARLHEVSPNNVAMPIAAVRLPSIQLAGFHGDQEEDIGYLMKYIDGKLFSSYIDKIYTPGVGRSELAVVTDISMQAIAVLNTFYDNGLAHGDSHPNNWIVVDDKRPVVFDPKIWALRDYTPEENMVAAMREDRTNIELIERHLAKITEKQ